MLVFEEGGKPENPEKNPQSKGENQQQTQPTYDAGSGNRTQGTLVEASALTTAPPLLPCSAIAGKGAGVRVSQPWLLLYNNEQ